MKRKSLPHEDLVWWLKFFDFDYMGSDLCNQLSDLDINSPTGRARAIELAVIPEFNTLSEIAKARMLQVLSSALTASDDELAAMFERISMPFISEISDRRCLLRSIHDACDVKSISPSSNE